MMLERSERPNKQTQRLIHECFFHLILIKNVWGKLHIISPDVKCVYIGHQAHHGVIQSSQMTLKLNWQ